MLTGGKVRWLGVFVLFAAAMIAGCSGYPTRQEARPYDQRVWPPVVEGAAFPEQHLWDP